MVLRAFSLHRSLLLLDCLVRIRSHSITKHKHISHNLLSLMAFLCSLRNFPPVAKLELIILFLDHVKDKIYYYSLLFFFLSLKYSIL